ncbi:hypothetical protein CKM354_000550600 [Cercospora kikuchii]|uniref:Transcription factor domain-containing protein n=1 Tax=Cercospora kikuchii TaxID=84275 RepID=A0A9P3CKQ7_9PEZI|nr:uncharacterized protein CKM354_000550600 [Cercospora kikuchii]GIZ42230.1 hypothetical protein CKM354_000550600 [Cercospora kikuchii]
MCLDTIEQTVPEMVSVSPTGRNNALTKLVIRDATTAQSERPRSKAPRYISINLRPVQQMQMLSDFLGANFPSTKARAGLANRGSYLAILPDLDVESTPMLNAAINALCWAHIGAKTGDRRLVQRSQASYGQVLSMLITTVHKNSRLSLVEPRAVITSMMLLCLYDGSIPMPSDGENGWRAHYWACQNLLGAYGPSCIRLHDPFDKMLFNSLRMPCFFLGVAKRKKIAFGQPEWLQLAQDINPVTDTFTSYYSAAMRIPSILERVDRILAAPLMPTALKGLCQDIYDLRQDVTQWFTSLVSYSKDPSWEIPELVEITKRTPMLNNEEHLYMRRSKVFSKFLQFGLPMKIVQNHTLAALAYIVLDCSLLRLLHFKAMTAVCIRPETIKDVEKRAFMQAVGLCQSLYHYTSFDGLAYVDFSEFLNDVALNFFQEVGATKETDWCRGIRAAMTLRRSRIKTDIQRRTLCRMGDAGPGFAMACRYKTWDLQS